MQYKRILLKLSGEALMGEQTYGIDKTRLDQYAREIKSITDAGVQVGIIIGGGNIFRGMAGAAQGMDRIQGDYMGMLATVINALALCGALESCGVAARLQTAVEMPRIAESFSQRRALSHLEKGKVVIFGGGTGNPFFTTDTAAALRAVEIGADAILKGTRVDGIYTADPEKDPSARKFETITYQELYRRGLKIMDMTAFTMSQENHLPIVVFDMNTPGNLYKVCSGEKIGTRVVE